MVARGGFAPLVSAIMHLFHVVFPNPNGMAATVSPPPAEPQGGGTSRSGELPPGLVLVQSRYMLVTMNTLESRLVSLERSNRRLQAAAAVAVLGTLAFFFLGQAREPVPQPVTGSAKLPSMTEQAIHANIDAVGEEHPQVCPVPAGGWALVVSPLGKPYCIRENGQMSQAMRETTGVAADGSKATVYEEWSVRFDIPNGSGGTTKPPARRTSP